MAINGIISYLSYTYTSDEYIRYICENPFNPFNLRSNIVSVVSKTKSYCSTTSKRKTQPFLRFGSLPVKRAE